MMKRLAPLSLLVLAACSGGFDISDFRARPAPQPAAIAPPAPQPTLLTAKERLVRAIEDNGCTLSGANVGTILTEATISQEELLRLAPQLEAEGRVEVAGSGAIRVLSPRCQQTT